MLKKNDVVVLLLGKYEGENGVVLKESWGNLVLIDMGNHTKLISIHIVQKVEGDVNDLAE